MDQERTIKDILEIIQFIKDNAITKDYLDERLSNLVSKDYLDERLSNLVSKDYLDERLSNLVSKDYFDEHLEERLTEVKSEIMGHVDGFVALHQKLDIELTALRHKYTRLEGYVFQLAKHLQVELG